MVPDAAGGDAASAALQRLLDDLPDPALTDHPVDLGALGEYAETLRRLGPESAGDAYPRVAGHLRTGCERCRADLADLERLARLDARGGRRPPSAGTTRLPTTDATAAGGAGSAVPVDPASPRVPEPLDLAEAATLARAVEAERDALAAPLPPDLTGRVASARLFRRRRERLLVEAALVGQRLALRRLFVERARAGAAGPPSASPSGPFDAPRPGRVPSSPRARLLLDELSRGADDLARLDGRLDRVAAELRRLGAEPRGPARSHAAALLDRGTALARDALELDRRLARLQGTLAGMLG